MTCPICHGAGFIGTGSKDINDPCFGKSIPCECKRKETDEFSRTRALELWANSDIADWQRQWTLDNHPGDKRAIAEARRAVKAIRGVWIFWSAIYGTGKSGLLIAAANTLAQSGIQCVYRSASALLDELRAGYQDDCYYEKFQALHVVPVLMIDEFYRVTGTIRKDNGTAQGWADEKMTELFDWRYNHFDTLMTMLATNKKPDAGDMHPISSRLTDNLRCRVVEVRGIDLRPHAREMECKNV